MGILSRGVRHKRSQTKLARRTEAARSIQRQVSAGESSNSRNGLVPHGETNGGMLEPVEETISPSKPPLREG